MRNISKIPCTVEDCDKPNRTRGWCSMHYNRWIRNGDPALRYRLQEKIPDDGFWAQVDLCRVARIMQP